MLFRSTLYKLLSYLCGRRNTLTKIRQAYGQFFSVLAGRHRPSAHAYSQLRWWSSAGLVLADVLFAADMGVTGYVLRVPALRPAAAVGLCGCAALGAGADRDAVRPGIVGTD